MHWPGSTCASSAHAPRHDDLLPHQCKQVHINELPVLQEMLPQQSFLHEAAFLKDTGRRRVVRDDVGHDLDQGELVESVLAGTLNHSGHDASAPERLCQPVANLGSVRFADLKVIQAAATDQGVGGAANGEMSGLAVLIGGLGNTSEKCFSRVFGGSMLCGLGQTTQTVPILQQASIRQL